MLYSLHDALRVATPCVLLVMGAALCGYARYHRFAVEELVKDGQRTEADARRAIAFFRWSGPAITALGVVLLTIAGWNTLQ